MLPLEVLVEAVGALRPRLWLPLLLLPLEVRPGHPSVPHGLGTSRCGRSRVRGAPRPQPQPAAMLAAAAPLPCSRRSRTRPLSPASSRPGLGGGTRPHWRSPSAPWGGRRRSVPSGSPTRVPPSTPHQMSVSSLLSDPHTPVVLLPSWLVMGLAFLSPRWVLLLVLFAFLMFLLLLRWFTTFFSFASLLLITIVPLNFTLLVLL